MKSFSRGLRASLPNAIDEWSQHPEDRRIEYFPDRCDICARRYSRPSMISESYVLNMGDVLNLKMRSMGRNDMTTTIKAYGLCPECANEIDAMIHQMILAKTEKEKNNG